MMIMDANEARQASNEAPFLELMKDIDKAAARGYRTAMARLEHMNSDEEREFVKRVEELGYKVSSETSIHGYNRRITWVEVKW